MMLLNAAPPVEGRPGPSSPQRNTSARGVRHPLPGLQYLSERAMSDGNEFTSNGPPPSLNARRAAPPWRVAAALSSFANRPPLAVAGHALVTDFWRGSSAIAGALHARFGCRPRRRHRLCGVRDSALLCTGTQTHHAPRTYPYGQRKNGHNIAPLCEEAVRSRMALRLPSGSTAFAPHGASGLGPFAIGRKVVAPGGFTFADGTMLPRDVLLVVPANEMSIPRSMAVEAPSALPMFDRFLFSRIHEAVCGDDAEFWVEKKQDAHTSEDVATENKL
ncbi:hypothetical protein GGX14DRAFT_394629 [Mycena pura]|uniref:Uncharacterized protein n=1 Tax=Mycena pura TaxID=153505 RepID=A0AAD6VFB9_9AGAR|nr:hypothetical protein GGX14DRAFT_394629 [Mycena pura]